MDAASQIGTAVQTLTRGQQSLEGGTWGFMLQFVAYTKEVTTACGLSITSLCKVQLTELNALIAVVIPNWQSSRMPLGNNPAPSATTATFQGIVWLSKIILRYLT
jgi:hypothetical protein